MTSTAMRKRRPVRDLTEKQVEALKIGQRIRYLMCILAMGKRGDVGAANKKTLLDIVDDELHKMGYESFTEQRARINEFFKDPRGDHMSAAEFRKFQRLQRLP
jgi:hypothetical protein